MKELSASCVSSGSWIFARIWAAFLLVLVVVTYPLWFTALDLRPSLTVPLLPVIRFLPGYLTILPSITLVTGLIIAVLARQNNRVQLGWVLVAASLLMTFLVDQHRLQPWAYQSFFYALIFSSMDSVTCRKWIMPLAASVYVYSAAGKFDFQFQHTVGQDLIAVLTGFMGGLPADIDRATVTRLALFFPTVELLAGLGLYLRKTRRLSVIVLTLMHVSLLVLLGPWGLDHSRGVLLWNLMLITQAYFVFWSRYETDLPAGSADAPVADRTVTAGQRCYESRFFSGGVKFMVVLAILCPLLERSGYWDHWTSWSLYSPHTSRAEIELHRSVMGDLDPRIVEFLEEDEDRDGWHRLSLESWSLGRRFVPIYPQARYQLAIANQLCAASGLDAQIRVKLKGVADRWTGARSESRLMGKQQIKEACEDFWLNTGGTMKWSDAP